MFKYLAGNYFIKERAGVSAALLLTVKRDSYQHRDMAQNFGFDPINGGFAALQKETPNEMFFGESVSCRVKTCEITNPDLFNLVNNGNIYQLSTYKEKDVWMFLENDYTPDPDEGVEYEKISMEEFKERTDKLIKDPFYF